MEFQLYKYFSISQNLIHCQKNFLLAWFQSTHGHTKPPDMRINAVKEKLDWKQSILT